LAVTAEASGTVAVGALPSITDDPEAFAAQVHDRLQGLDEKVQGAREFTAAEIRTREEAITGLRKDLTVAVDRVKRLAESVAVDGLVLQGRGWFLVLVGVLLGGIGNFVEAR
jgi:hypothetical protein